MNKILKKILLTAKDIAVETATQALPGASVAIDGVTKLFDKDDSNNRAAIQQIEDGVIQAIGSLDSTKVSDALLIADGIKDIQSGFDKIKAGLKH